MPRDTAVATEFAPAKINLALHVVGKRGDGYHLLESLVVFGADLGDTVAASPADHPSLQIDGPFAGPLKSGDPWDNLAIRAADQLLGERYPVALAVEKHIPVAAGLGGGSADAAATLRLLNRTLDMRLGDERLAEIGLRLGADVPMCVVSRPAIARGVGEGLTAIAGFPALHLVLACPPVAVKTADVFRALARPDNPPLPSLPRLADGANLAAWLRTTRNDLAPAALSVSPAAGAAAAALAGDRTCLFARMSGSGPSAFGLFATRTDADRASSRLAAAEPAWWVHAITTGAS